MRIYDATGGISDRALNVYDGHAGNVTALGFQRDARWLWTASDDGTAKVWDLRSPLPQRELENMPRHRSPYESPTSARPQERVFEPLERQTLKAALQESTIGTERMRMEANARMLARTEGNRGRTMHLPNSALYFMRRDRPAPIHCGALHPLNQAEFVTADEGGVVALWDLGKEALLRVFLSGSRTPVKSVAISADGRFIAACNYKVPSKI